MWYRKLTGFVLFVRASPLEHVVRHAQQKCVQGFVDVGPTVYVHVEARVSVSPAGPVRDAADVIRPVTTQDQIEGKRWSVHTTNLRPTIHLRGYVRRDGSYRSRRLAQTRLGEPISEHEERE